METEIKKTSHFLTGGISRLWSKFVHWRLRRVIDNPKWIHHKQNHKKENYYTIDNYLIYCDDTFEHCITFWFYSLRLYGVLYCGMYTTLYNRDFPKEVIQNTEKIKFPTEKIELWARLTFGDRVG